MHAEPTPGPVRTFGILNIIFSCLMLLCVSCMAVYTAFLVAMQPVMNAAQNQIKAQHQKKIDDLQEQFAKSNDATERAELQGQIDAQKRMPMPVMPDSSKMSGLDNPTVWGFYVVDAATGFVLNIVMLVIGCGLMRIREWARQGAVVLSAIKIVRLVLLYGIGIAIIAPIQGRASASGVVDMMQQMQQQQQVPMPFEQLAMMYTIMMTGSFVATMIFGAIYPGISLWVLTRDGAKAATRRSIG